MSKFLSVQILTCNSEDNIVRCIKSLLPLAEFIEEIVIVDDESKDNTLLMARNISKQWQVKMTIISNKKGDAGFAGQRNLGIQHSKGSWILILDSDETVHPDMYWELLQMTQRSDVVAWYFPRVLLFPDESKFLIDAYPDYQMRLFKKLDGIKFTRLVHEYLIFIDKDGKEHSLGINQQGTKITKKVNFYHYQLLSSKEKLEEKGERWMKLSKESKQGGFNIVGKDAFQFNTYQHRIANLPEALKIKDISKNLVLENTNSLVSFDDNGWADKNVNSQPYWNLLFKEYQERDNGTTIINKRCEDSAKEIRDIFQQYSHIPVKRILEIGCGTKSDSYHLVKLGYDVTTVDISDYIIELQKDQLPGPNYLQMDARELKFSDSSFDCIFSTDVFEHFPETEKTVQEWLRVLVPGGVILVTTVGQNHESIPTHCKYFTKENLRTELGLGEETELTILRCGDFEYEDGNFPRNRGDRNMTFLLRKPI